MASHPVLSGVLSTVQLSVLAIILYGCHDGHTGGAHAALAGGCTNATCGANATCTELTSSTTPAANATHPNITAPVHHTCDCLPGFANTTSGCERIDFCAAPCAAHNIQQSFDSATNATSGWLRDGVPYSTVTTCGGFEVLGGYGEAAAGTVLSRAFSALPDHASLSIQLTVLAIDLWENESIVLVVDGVQQATLTALDTAAMAPGGDVCGLPGQDPGVYQLSANAPHSAGSLTVELRATPNQGLANESWGLVDFELELRRAEPCHTCSPNGTCSWDPSGPQCSCHSGMVGDGHSCEAEEECSARCQLHAGCDVSGVCVCDRQFVTLTEGCSLGACLTQRWEQYPNHLRDFQPRGFKILETGEAVTTMQVGCSELYQGVVGDRHQLVPGNTLQQTASGLARHSHVMLQVEFRLAGTWRGERLTVYIDGVEIARTPPHFLDGGSGLCGKVGAVITSHLLAHDASSATLRVHADSVGASGSNTSTWQLIRVGLILDGAQALCSGEHEECHGSSVVDHSCDCLPGFEGDPCVDVDECAVPACARLEVADDFSLNGPAVGWPINAISSCGPLPLHLGGFGALSTQTMSKEFAINSTHSSVAMELQLVIIDSWAAVDVIQVFVDGRRVGQTPTPISSNTGALVCGDAAIPDPGLVVISLPETAHSGPTLQLELVPSLASPAAAWGIARVSITLDPSANPGCNECSRPHMVCTNKPGTAACACEAGYYRLGNECVDVDECAEDYLLENVFTSTGEETGWYDAARSFLRPTSLTQTSTCGGATMLGGPGMFGKFTMPERAFGSLPSHNALTVSLTLYIIDSWDANTVTMLVDGAAVDSLTLTHPSGTSSSGTGCGNATADVGLVVLTAHMASHSASDVVVRLTTDLAKPMAQAGYGIVSATITLHSAVCLPGEACANTVGSVNCICDGDSVYTADGQACVAGACPAFGEFEHNGFNLTGCAQGHARDDPNCTVACGTGTGGVGLWTCAPGGAWVPAYPLCVAYEPLLHSTAGAQYTGPPVDHNAGPTAAGNLVATISATNLDPADFLTVSNDPADFGSIRAVLSPTVDRTGHPPVRVQLNVSHTDTRGVTWVVEVAEFEMELFLPLASAGSIQFALAGQPFIGQEPTIVGGRPPYNFSLGGGAPPAGLQANARGTIIGTAAQVGDFSGVVVRVTDTNGASLSLEPINFQVIQALTVTTNASGLLPTAVAGIEYFQGFNFTATGGSGGVTFRALGSVPASLAVDPESGALIGFPLPSSARAEPYLFEIVASDDSGIQVVALVVSLVVEARPDCDDPGNGPNGQGCGTGLCVDLVAFDGNFSCECNATGLGGDNCQLVDGRETGGAGSRAGLSPAVLGTIGALAALVVILVVIALLVRRAQVRARSQPFDFKAELERMQDEGLVVLFAGDGGDGMPREIKRSNIQLLDKLGAGQFGDVFKGTVDESAATGIPAYLVAVKTLKGDPSSWEMTELMREAALMAQFRHPNVVNLVGVCTRGEPYYLVVQFCEHGALVDYLKAQPQRLEEAVMMKMAHEIATGMEYLSGAGLVHRDLAARNVLLDSQVVCKVADFGMSRDVRATDKAYYRSGKSGMMPVRWAAPEALEEQLFSEQSDVWAWGITVFEILTGGELPYNGWTNQKVWVCVKGGFRLACPKGVDAKLFTEIIEPCWMGDPGLRPTFEKLCGQLEGRFASLSRVENCYQAGSKIRGGDTLYPAPDVVDATQLPIDIAAEEGRAGGDRATTAPATGDRTLSTLATHYEQGAFISSDFLPPVSPPQSQGGASTSTGTDVMSSGGFVYAPIEPLSTDEDAAPGSPTSPAPVLLAASEPDYGELASGFRYAPVDVSLGAADVLSEAAARVAGQGAGGAGVPEDDPVYLMLAPSSGRTAAGLMSWV